MDSMSHKNLSYEWHLRQHYSSGRSEYTSHRRSTITNENYYADFYLSNSKLAIFWLVAGIVLFGLIVVQSYS